MNNVRSKSLLLIVLASLFMWGCTETKTTPRTAARIRHLETQNTRLEEDYQAAVNECNVLRRQLEQARKDYQRLRAQQKGQEALLRTVSQERDELRRSLEAVTQDRDALAQQISEIGQDLQNLVARFQQATRGSSSNVPAAEVEVTPSE